MWKRGDELIFLHQFSILSVFLSFAKSGVTGSSQFVHNCARASGCEVPRFRGVPEGGPDFTQTLRNTTFALKKKKEAIYTKQRAHANIFCKRDAASFQRGEVGATERNSATEALSRTDFRTSSELGVR